MMPDYLYMSWEASAPAISNHLWQSTLFVAFVGLLTLALRKNQARIRYWLWLVASVKFIIPFSFLIAIGSHMARTPALPEEQPSVFAAMSEASHPFIQPTMFMAAPTSATDHLGFTRLLPAILIAVWLCGFMAILSIWCLRWWRISASLRQAVPLCEGREVETLRQLEHVGTQKRIKLLSCKASVEPGILGIIRPVLVWPEGISEHLDDAQLEAVLAHEVLHVRRHDNLTSTIHMLVEAIFWFHPLVWWLGARLVEEREKACDEQVLQLGSSPHVYAESILTVCKYCIGSPFSCISGITGADLKKRIVHIMSQRPEATLCFSKRLLLAAAAIAVGAGPLAFGMMNLIPMRAQLIHTSGPLPSFEVATIKPSAHEDAPPSATWGPIRFTAQNLSLKTLIKVAYEVKTDAQLAGEPKWVDDDKFDIAAKLDDSQVKALSKLPLSERMDEIHLMLRSLLAERFKLKVSYDTKQEPVFALIVAKNGPKLTEVNGVKSINGRLPPPPPPGAKIPPGVHLPRMRETRGELKASAIPMTIFSDWISRQPAASGRVVLDATGLTGNYDFTLRWAPDDAATELLRTDNQKSTDVLSTESFEPPFSAALREQLGLELKPTKGSVQVLVVDQIARPSAD